MIWGTAWKKKKMKREKKKGIEILLAAMMVISLFAAIALGTVASDTLSSIPTGDGESSGTKGAHPEEKEIFEQKIGPEEANVRCLVLLGGRDETAFIVSDFSAHMTDIYFEPYFANDYTPSLDYLLEFDVVLLFENGLFENSENVGNAVYDYVMHGGNVVIGTFYWQDRSDNTKYGSNGWGNLETIDPFTSDTQGCEYNYDEIDPATIVQHPITNGVSTLWANSYRGGVSVATKPETTVLAYWTTPNYLGEPDPLVGYKELDQRLVAISIFPAYGTHGSEFGGDFYTLWENALKWAASAPSCCAEYAVYQAGVPDPDEILDPLRELRDDYLKEEYVDRYYDYSTELTMAMTKDPALAYEAARLLVKYSPMIQQQVTGTGKVKLITRSDVEEAVSFTDGLKRSVLKNRGEIGATRSQEIIKYMDEFKEQVEASEGKTFSEALQSSIYCESEPMPDLVITNIRLDGNKVKYTIKNQGEAATGGLFVNTLLVDGVPVSEDRINRLIQPGQGLEKTLILSGPLKISPNTTIVVCADFKNKVPESDEENNCLVLV